VSGGQSEIDRPPRRISISGDQATERQTPLIPNMVFYMKDPGIAALDRELMCATTTIRHVSLDPVTTTEISEIPPCSEERTACSASFVVLPHIIRSNFELTIERVRSPVMFSIGRLVQRLTSTRRHATVLPPPSNGGITPAVRAFSAVGWRFQ